MKLIKKIFIVLLMLSLQFGNLGGVLVYAQEATISATLAPSPSPTPIQSEPTVEPSATPTLSPTPVVIPEDITIQEESVATASALNPLTSPEPVTSARIKPPVVVHKLSKKNFRADEKISIVVANAKASEVKVKLFSFDGNEVAVEIEEVSEAYPAVLRIIPPKQFKAGRYRLKITDPDGKTTTQDFTWGVLAINTDKSIYLPNETANLQMAVLDETGLMVCDALVKLEIRLPAGEAGNPKSETEILSTENGKIIVNPECKIKDFVGKPDYEATYQVGEAGLYQLKLTAETKNGTYSISDAFEVREDVPFDVKRIAHTRLFPPITYPVVFEITANEDFNGTIVETVPDTFAISQTEGVRNFDAIELVATEEVIQDTLDAAIFGLVAPFDNAHPINLKFGKQLLDSLQKSKYEEYGLLGHDGVDFDMEEGTPVLAVDDGVVVRARNNWDYGTTVVIQHKWGKSYYGHLSLITKKEGDKVRKGYPIALSGSTGLSTGPHLHFGIKPNNSDPDNGYFGKIDPLAYLNIKEGNQNVLAQDNNTGQKVLSVSTARAEFNAQQIKWNLSVKKGEKIKIGYSFQVPNISPQFYLIGPLTFKDQEDKVVFQEARSWQLAVDADGSGTNTVSPTTGSTGATGQTYTFTFTAAETMDSGGFTISVPAGWSAPQGTGGTAGYTTAVGNSTATVARFISNADSITGWAEDDNDTCNSGSQLSVDTTTKQEGTGAILCDNNTSTAPDGDDSFSFAFTAEDWSSYSQISAWFRSDDGRASGEVQFAYDDDAPCWGTGGNAGVVEAFADFALTADTWTYIKRTPTATRTSIVAVCIGSGGDGFDNDSIWVDDVLIGPGVPTFSGSGPWTISARILDAANTETFTVIYGDTAGGAGSEVTNSSTAGTHTFTTQSRISDAGTLTNISSQPTVELTTSGPTNAQLMRHGTWFDSGVEQPFTF